MSTESEPMEWKNRIVDLLFGYPELSGLEVKVRALEENGHSATEIAKLLRVEEPLVDVASYWAAEKLSYPVLREEK